ncbi:MAG TPA: alpha/beta hydrolase [Planctomycetes bacterium]|nr:alpha/beta hydrolase [Planctomycetaceae bacterium]HIN95699.1 alpha/beta hydrolase [Planctomycetota bacterium]
MNAISTLLLLTLPLAAAPPKGPVVVKDVQVKASGKPILVWPGKAPNEPPGIAEKKAAPQTGADGVIRIPYVDTPELIHFPAPENKKNGTCIIVCPGGGYGKLAWNKEGTEVASWLNTLGVEAVALKYRVPRRDREKPHPWPMQDLHRSIRLVRSKATQWKIDPNRIGILGFSAGGHLAVMSISQQGKDSYPPIDAIDKFDRRPNFMALIYPAYLGNSKKDSSKLDPLVKIDAKTPPTFIAITHDDADRALFAALYYAELQRHRVSAELHIYSKGGHGYGLRPSPNPVSSWPSRLEDWLKTSGWLTP